MEQIERKRIRTAAVGAAQVDSVTVWVTVTVA